MSFSIKLNKTEIAQNGEGVVGIISIGDFKETFTTPLIYWSAEDYEDHWRSSLQRLIERKDSCLITSLLDPKTTNFNNWWLLYIRGDDVLIQNHLLLMDKLPRQFTPDDPYQFIPEHVRRNEDGDEISEWVLPLADFEAFLVNSERTGFAASEESAK